MANVTTSSGAATGVKTKAAGGGGGTMSHGSSLFDRYKPEQGKKVRGFTILGAAVMIFGAGRFVFDRLSVYRDPNQAWTQVVAVGVPALVVVVLAWLSFYYIYRKRGSSDFLIATEGEMKKVSWSSRREVIGSTKVVILFTVLLAVFLGLVDFLFMNLFRFIGVLKLGAAATGKSS